MKKGVFCIMKRFRVGVIGVGFIGAVHIEQLRRLGNVDVVAVADSHGAYLLSRMEDARIKSMGVVIFMFSSLPSVR